MAVLNRDLGRERRVASQPVAKITIDPEPCMTMLLEKIRKSVRSLGDCCLCLQHMFKDQPWLLLASRETRSAARTHKRIAQTCHPLIALISREYLISRVSGETRSAARNVPSVNFAHISTQTEATQTLLT